MQSQLEGQKTIFVIVQICGFQLVLLYRYIINFYLSRCIFHLLYVLISVWLLCALNACQNMLFPWVFLHKNGNKRKLTNDNKTHDQHLGVGLKTKFLPHFAGGY